VWKIVLIGIGIAVGLASSWIWIANERFDHQVDERISAMLEQRAYEDHIVVSSDLLGLPAPVQHWLECSGVLGQPMPTTIRLQQLGEIRLGPDQAWMSFHADQYYTIDPPAFLWRVSASAAPGIFIRGVDALSDGRGSMQMVLMAVSKVVDASGPTIDQGAALRYLQEIVWFPTAALSPAISWQSVGENSAQATLALDTLSVTGTFFFDAAGRVVNFTALRYRDGVGLEPWNTPMREHKEMDGIVVPTEGEGVWGDGEDAFSYIQVRLVDLQRDPEETYP
jgi:hypothetical protein